MAFSSSSDSTLKPLQPVSSGPVGNRPMVNQPGSKQPLVRSLDEKDAKGKNGKSMGKGVLPRKMLIGGIVGIVVAGLATGFVAAQFLPGGPTLEEKMAQVQREEEISGSQIRAGAVFGVPDEKTFKDTTHGVLIVGGIEGEGSHTLLREGGISQNVYLTSSVVDLDQFKDMEIKVWGETFKGQKAGWLMDVGRVEVVNTSAAKPSWYEAAE
jgi:hypothetical protein